MLVHAVLEVGDGISCPRRKAQIVAHNNGGDGESHIGDCKRPADAVERAEREWRCRIGVFDQLGSAIPTLRDEFGRSWINVLICSNAST